jgi:hypothetical protein
MTRRSGEPMEDYLARSLALNQARVDACIRKAKEENRPPKGEHVLTVLGIPKLPDYLPLSVRQGK